MSQHAGQKDKPFPCSLVDGHINPCWALNEVLQSYGGRGTRSQGIEMQTMLNMTSMEFSRNLVIAKSGKHGKKGLVFNFCPYCRGELVEDAEKNLATALSKAEGRIGQELAPGDSAQ